MRESIDLNQVGSRRASTVLSSILRLDARVFEYRDELTRSRYYATARSPAERRVALLYRESGELVGYNLITLSTVDAAGRRWSVVTSNAGFHPDHVGRNRTLPDAFRLMTRWMLREPGRRWTFVSYIVNPAAYDLLVDVNPSITPSPRHPQLDPAEQALLRVTAQGSGHAIERDDPSGLTILLRRPTARFLPRAETPAMEFYRARCPNFERGEALGICAQITPAAVMTGLARHARRWWQRRRRHEVLGEERPSVVS